jgi:hypothetical protein
MLKKQHFSIALITGILFSLIFLSNIGINNSIVHVAYGHSFTPNDYASFIASIDQFQTESKLVQTSIVNNNLTLAQEHADKNANIYFQNLMFEIAVHDQKMAEDLSKAVKSLKNIPLSVSSASASPVVEQQQQQRVNQLVAEIDSKVDEIITMTIRQQEVGLGFLEPVMGLISSIFGEKKDGVNSKIHPLRVAELVDSGLRNYGNAYGVSYDMTNMSNMAMMENNSSLSISRMTDGNNSIIGADPTNMSSAMMNSGSNMSKNYSLANVAYYQSAQALSAKALEVFNNELKPMVSDNDSTFYITSLENGLIKLNDSIKDKALPMDIMMIVHTQIHPNLLEAFDVPLQSGV